MLWTVSQAGTQTPLATMLMMESECSSFIYYSTPVMEQSIVISPSVCLTLCLSVFLSGHISSEPRDLSTPNFLCMLLRPWLGPPLLVLRYIMYFRFVDNIMFAHNGLRGSMDLTLWRIVRLSHQVAAPDRSGVLMSTTASVK